MDPRPRIGRVLPFENRLRVWVANLTSIFFLLLSCPLPILSPFSFSFLLIHFTIFLPCSSFLHLRFIYRYIPFQFVPFSVFLSLLCLRFPIYSNLFSHSPFFPLLEAFISCTLVQLLPSSEIPYLLSLHYPLIFPIIS